MYKELYYTDDLVNLAEEAVFEAIHHSIENDPEMNSFSEVTLQDIAAIALNNTPAKYVCNYLEKHNPGEQLKADIEILKKQAAKEVKKALKKVVKIPHD